jgi:hypothetical protein
VHDVWGHIQRDPAPRSPVKSGPGVPPPQKSRNPQGQAARNRCR